MFTLILFILITSRPTGPNYYRIEKIHGFATVKDCELAAAAAHEGFTKNNEFGVKAVCVKELKNEKPGLL